jgi:hypothetical protein
LRERMKAVEEEKAVREKRAKEDAFQRDIEAHREKMDKNGEWMNRIRVSNRD